MIDSMYTVGEFAEKMKVSVRTLQYYDKQGLLKPTSHSEGGRRLYSSHDAIILQQILSLKYIGLSLEEIKTQISFQTSDVDIRSVIARQTAMLEEQMSRMQKSLFALKIIEKDLQDSSEVDLAMVADAIYLIHSIEERDWLELDEFDEALKSHIENKSNADEQFKLRLTRDFESVSNQMAELVQRSVDPTSDEGQIVARTMWDMIQDFTGGDMSLLPQLMEFSEDKEKWPNEMRKRQELIDDFMGRALTYLLENNQDISTDKGLSQ